MRRGFQLALAVVALGCGTTALAQDSGESDAPPKAEVVERDEDGRATRIRVEGQEYAVCSDTQTDNCINPAAAGFDFGGVPIDYWPGQPASEIDGPLPEHAPEQAEGN